MPIHSPDSTTETSPSLISRVKRLSESGSINKAKRAKGDREPEVQEEDRQGIQQAVGKQWEGRHTQPDLIKRTSTRLGSQSFKKVPLDSQVRDLSKKLEWMCVLGKAVVRDDLTSDPDIVLLQP